MRSAAAPFGGPHGRLPAGGGLRPFMHDRATGSPAGMLTLSLLLVAALAASPAGAEIYRCTGKGRLPVYQNFPCQFDRASSSDVAAAAGHEGMNRSPTATATPAGAAHASTPRIGMTTEQVRAIWGDPVDSSKEEFAKRDIEVWSYADSRSIEFDRKGIVTAIHW